MEMTVIKEEAFTHVSLETVVACQGEAIWVSTRVSQEAEGAGEIVGKNIYHGFCGKKWAK